MDFGKYVDNSGLSNYLQLYSMGNLLIKNIKGLTGVLEDKKAPLIGLELGSVQTIENAFLAIEDGRISMFGKMEDLAGITDWTDLEVIDAEGKFVLPAFCDSHTHIVFAKNQRR